MTEDEAGAVPGEMSPEERLFAAARTGDLETLTAMLDAAPGQLQAREPPYGWTLLHAAANRGQLGVVELLLARGLDPNVLEQGDRSYAMHWAAAGGHLDVVRRLADAGGDVVGHGDDHELEVIGWATCWPGGDDAAHRAVAEFLVERGARHHIFSAIALDLDDEVRHIVATDPSALERRMSRNENYQRPLHFAVRSNRPAMVALLLELGADPLATDGSGYTAVANATALDVDRPILEMIRARGAPVDLVTALALEDEDAATRLLQADPGALAPDGSGAGTLHLMAKRNHVAAVEWLLAHGADPNVRWNHWDVQVTPLHLAVMHGHVETVHALLAGGADPHIRDSMYDADPIGWADYFGRKELVELLGGAGAEARE